MPEIPNVNNVLEAFVYYWYENAILDNKKLQLLFAPDFKIQCQTTIASSTESISYYKFNDAGQLIEHHFLQHGVSNAEISMWTPTILSDGYQVVVMVNWKNERDELVLTSNDTFFLQRVMSSQQQRGLAIKSLTSHIVYYSGNGRE